jgi:hypothetical protein
VLFFGDLFTSSVATVGLNPSRLEYLDKHGKKLSGARRRFESITSMGYRYDRGETAHLDLSQEPTDPPWSKLRSEQPSDFALLQEVDLPFLRWQIATSPLRTVICNGRTVFELVLTLTGGRREKGGTIKRLAWYSATAEVGGRRIRIVGWIILLARPTGLGAAGEHDLGRLLGDVYPMCRSEAL